MSFWAGNRQPDLATLFRGILHGVSPHQLYFRRGWMFSGSGKFSFSFIIENNLNKLHKCLT